MTNINNKNVRVQSIPNCQERKENQKNKRKKAVSSMVFVVRISIKFFYFISTLKVAWWKKKFHTIPFSIGITSDIKYIAFLRVWFITFLLFTVNQCSLYNAPDHTSVRFCVWINKFLVQWNIETFIKLKTKYFSDGFLNIF